MKFLFLMRSGHEKVEPSVLPRIGPKFTFHYHRNRERQPFSGPTCTWADTVNQILIKKPRIVPTYLGKQRRAGQRQIDFQY